MMQRSSHLMAACLILLLSALPFSQAQTKKTLHAFMGGPDGRLPTGQLISDQSGNIYGATGGSGGIFGGVAYQLSPSTGGFSYTILFTFSTPKPGPYGGFLDLNNSLFGAGEYNAFQLRNDGSGTWQYKHLASYHGDQGYTAEGNVIADPQGNLYGVTYDGGANDNGTVFEISPSASGAWTYQVLYSFQFGADGSSPIGPLIIDASGNLYGMTELGGDSVYGTIFELSPDGSGGWTEQVLYSFSDGTDGSVPTGLILAPDGSFYGTTYSGGGKGNCQNAFHDSYCGTVFHLTSGTNGWTESVLYAFAGGSDGGGPTGNMAFDRNGNLYGTTFAGGQNANGTIFELTPQTDESWSETILYRFAGGRDGKGPESGILIDSRGNLYGTTTGGGFQNNGTVFELKP
jgi:uncharacterized repeat protein (TIGR03803 family)